MSCALARWGSSGLAYLTGLPGGPPDFSRANVLSRAETITAHAATLLTGRAGLLGLTRRGRVSAGGATRLVAAADGWLAITLSRPDDVAAVPALLQVDRLPEDPWPTLQRWVATSHRSTIIDRTQLLDIPAAALGEATAAPPRIRRVGPRGAVRGPAGLLVADLSSMWAGPLCGQLLARAGATVVKIESPRRPDGTRAGDRAFFDWINGEKLSYCLDFDEQAGELRQLLTVADIVIEGSRPAALARRRLGPDHIAPRPGRIWLRVNGYGEQPGRPAFGDDAAVAGGLVGSAADGPVFCGDAIADPLAGIEASQAITESLGRGGGELIHVSLTSVAASYAALPLTASASTYPALPPSPPPPCGAAAERGADNDAVRRLVGQRLARPC
ncbi:CoA transferase [Mycobacterium pseudokansasii]|uniref:Acetyl-CoA:oxalate CoA-transferase n=1 Tax=Mycobacterium pseudokansasii TaxID=2341080 RepID=A0A498QPH0_9MYCO|nr:CoA transferase [Mycobacterium pseudokansasii]KZS61678.1 acyl-CoA transferase [Mycobacterium kansasii]VAZ88107.1 Acetyl-CoA:oxalate CoA-transferase [Mycobacterium pseudokansasii]VAZ88553.1 Acetyl-CoA:oxalate CoA-transferase [Mycobacterium pseudokansasii]VBA46400.1 Acetyl-CoA:oxalate CoA-transferase [Mycobacterium pseudokansasii]